MATILGANTLSSGYDVANSCRFATNTYLAKTASSGNQRTFTVSFWAKRSMKATGHHHYPISFYQNANNRISFAFLSGNSFIIYAESGGSGQLTMQTNDLYRDPNAWVHVVIAFDTTQGTDSNRLKLYINGIQITSFADITYPTQNADLTVNTNIYIGIYDTSNNPFHGYLAEFVYIDGLQLDQTSFGEFDSDSPAIWKPKDPSGLTFGTNGFYLDFETSDTLGNDANGGTDFSNNNLTALDQSTDTCTNNFAIMNPFNKGGDITVSEGNLKVSNGNSDNSILGSIGLGNGKWYWEAKCTGQTTYANIGITLASADGTIHSTVDAGRIVYSHNGYVYKEGLSGQSNVSGLATFTTNDIISVAYDGENGSVKFYKGGVLINTTTDSDLVFSHSSDNEYIPSIGINQGGFELNFGSPIYSISSGNADANGYGNFEYAVPSGYFALCTKNLAEYG